MILPNKLISFNDSILAKTVFILDELAIIENVGIRVLYNKVKHNFEDINQYIIALDVLFTLEKINYNTETQVIEYAKADIL
ncbi:ABC-three component system middle component 7 [Anaerosolibacter sp.]|uniref:ABC-three component system middle component 7 n=1 Tax=Anaerosolibacter sp. TaxID=1872527 RepID=UPI0039EE26EA